MSLLADHSQRGLLDESLAMFSALLQRPDQSAEPWWSTSVRMQLHDELYQYFLALPMWAEDAREGDAPRVALEACLRPGAESSSPPRRAPSLARPVDLLGVEARRAKLRALVTLNAIERSLGATFGAAALNAPAGGKSEERLGVVLAEKFRRTLSLDAASRDVPPIPPGTDRFLLHLQVEDMLLDLLGGCLPFGSWGLSLPRILQQLMDLSSNLVTWLTSGLQPGRELFADVPGRPFYVWGLGVAIAGRAYLADWICSLVRVSLPLDRLYEESKLGSGASVSLSGRGERPSPVVTKLRYSAYTAVGLVEFLSGNRMLHPDPPSEGYTSAPGALQALGDWEPFAAFWGRDTSGLHGQILSALRAGWEKPVPRISYLPASGTPQEFMALDDLRRRMQEHAFPALVLPEPPKGPRKRPPPRSRPGFNTCGHFTTHLQLQAAKLLAVQVGRRLKNMGGRYRAVPTTEAEVWTGLGGSQRWGGNNAPHYEHRDGLTYDLTLPAPYEKWPTAPVYESAIAAAQANRKDPRKLFTAIGAPTVPGQQDRDVLALKDAASVPGDPALKRALPALAKKLMAGESVEDAEWDAFAGTTIMFSGKGIPDWEKQLGNLVGHIALAIVGVRKWCYGSLYEHLFALKAIGLLLQASGWTSLSPGDLKDLGTTIAGAEFYWMPIDHNDHWHVVFRSYHKGDDSLGPAPYVLDARGLGRLVRICMCLGVDLGGYVKGLEQRSVAHETEFPALKKERDDLIALFNGAKKQFDQQLAREAAEQGKAPKAVLDVRRDALLEVLTDAIDGMDYDQIPSLQDKTIREWIRDSELAHSHSTGEGDIPQWKYWKTDIEPIEAAPELPNRIDGIDVTG